jgi:hypothetical protein
MMKGNTWYPPQANDDFAADVRAELKRARENFQPLHSAHEGFAVLLEEVEELKAEVFRKGRSEARMYWELVQVAAMAERMAQDLNLARFDGTEGEVE